MRQGSGAFSATPSKPKKLKTSRNTQPTTSSLKVTDYYDLSLPLPHIPVGGRLKYFKSAWYSLTKDPELITMISKCPISISHSVPSVHSVRDIRMSKSEIKDAQDHIKQLLNKKAIMKSKREEGDFLSNIFLCAKKDGGAHVILNLKNFNKHVEKMHFRMETLQSILHLVTKDCWQTVLDLQDAYLTVPIDPDHAIYLKFTFQGQIYMYIVLPFGYKLAPRIFTKIIKPLVASLHSLGHTVTFYLDDSWQATQSFKSCIHSCKATLNLLKSCGFVPNTKKSKLIPSQIVCVLGTIINSRSMTIYLPSDKERNIINIITNVLRKHHLTIWDLARLIGKLISYTMVCPLGKLYYRSLEKVKICFLQLNNYNWDGNCRLNNDCRLELSWWLENLPNCSAPIVRPNPHMSIHLMLATTVGVVILMAHPLMGISLQLNYHCL